MHSMQLRDEPSVIQPTGVPSHPINLRLMSLRNGMIFTVTFLSLQSLFHVRINSISGPSIA
jgi:hypothetical protein